MEMPRSLQKLKKTIIDYLLLQQCHQAKKSSFWHRLESHLNTRLCPTDYGISKMKKLFEMFNDVLRFSANGKYVQLREEVILKNTKPKQDRHRQESESSSMSNVDDSDVITICDSDDSDSSDSAPQSKQKSQKSVNTSSHVTSREFSRSWGSGAGSSFSTSGAAVPPPDSNLDFLPFSSEGATKSSHGDRAKSQPSHIRYGKSSTEPEMSLPPSLRKSNFQNSQSAPNPQPSLYRSQPGGMGGPQQALFRHQAGQMGNLQNVHQAPSGGIGSQQNLYRTQSGQFGSQSNLFQNQLEQMGSQQNLYQSATIGAAHSLRGNHQQSMAGVMGAPLIQGPPQRAMTPSSLKMPDRMPPGAVGGFASPAMLQPPATTQMSTMTEWPKPRPRTGPPPGTKITDPPKNIKVKSVTLPRGSRLSVEQVNYEINDCIEILSNANEHVSMERIEEMLLKKFQVSNFRNLNLQQRFMGQLDAANEHSRLLCKVNAYVQNFARSRSLCTLYELGECCRDFHKHGEEFDKLRLGPLQKMPVVHDLFKFPFNEYIPEVTTIDIMEHLNNFLTRNNKWTTQVQLEEFMKYLEEEFEIENRLSLGLRLRSVPLAIQTLKKSQRDAGQSRKKVVEEMRVLLQKDIHEAFSRYRESLLQTSDSTGTHELRLHYCNLAPANAVREILQKFTVLTEIMVADIPSSKARQLERFMRSFDSFGKHLFDDTIPQRLFHLAVCMSNIDVEQTALEFLAHQRQQSELRSQQEVPTEDKQPPPKNVVTDKILIYLNKCLEIGALQLSHLKSIEEKIIEDYGFSSFQQIGHSSFLEFLLSDKKLRQVLEECGGTLLGSLSTFHENSGSVIASQKDVVKFICQSRDAGVIQVEQLAHGLCEQYHVAEVKALGHGNINRLCQIADKSTKNVFKHHNCVFEAAMCGKVCCTTRSYEKVGLQGSQSRESAIACLTACPLLEDMSDWSHWPLLFQPQHGSLRDFISEFGGVHFLNIDGGKRMATSDFMAIETEPGKFLKLSAQSTQEDFISALEAEDPLLSAGHLVSLIVSNKGIEATPLALLSNHIKSKLISLHARMATPGGPPHLGSTDMVDPAVQFITTMLLHLPLRICISVANQVLLEPLSQVVGSAKSKVCIAQACRSPVQCLKLEQLGCLLGLQEWMTPMTSRMAFPAHLIQDNAAEDDLSDDEHPKEAESDSEEEEEESGEEDTSSEEQDEESEIEHILSVESFQKEGEKADKTDDTQDKGKERSPEEDDEESDEEESGSSDESEDSYESTEDVPEETKADTETGSTIKGERTMSVTENDDNVNDEHEEKKEEVAGEIERELTKEEKCQKIVDSIREKEFGVGIELTEEIQDLMQKQQERQGRSLERLSKELYSKDTHFVLELIQNADDNHYDDNLVPAIKFVIDSNGVTVMNNELGFEEKNIRALCDVGKSTKPKHNLGYIGQKGIGFKSVFRVTGKPEVHSNGYHIYFDVNSGPMGYILPHWCNTWDASPSWQTQIGLPWTKEIMTQISTHAARFNDIQPSLLLFLHRLKRITIDNEVENGKFHMEREDLDHGQVQISHTHGKDRWLVVRKRLDASSVSLQVKSGVEIDSTEIALAFPINNQEASRNTRAKPSHLPVFAFLPLRSYGFKFIIQGDFDVPSSREDVDRDSSWNQWLRNEVPSLFLDAWDSFQALPTLSPIEALVKYLQFIPMDGEVMDFFKPVSHRILAQLRAKEFLPVMGPSDDLQWKMPSKTVISRDALVREIISPGLLKHHLALYYLHDDIANVLDNAQVEALGVEKITTDQLLLIGQSVTINWNDQGNPDQVVDIAKWMACVYRSLDDFQDNTGVIQKLRTLKIVPLSSGTLVSVEDSTVFLLQEEKQNVAPSYKKGKAAPQAKDPFQELKNDLCLVHSALTATSDMEINSQVIKLLLKMGVKHMTPHDLIHSHIMPTFESGQWKKKQDQVVVNYLTYIKSEMDKRPGILEFERLRPVAAVLTNHGVKVPAQDNVHFSKVFGNPFDLVNTFPGMKWTLVDRSYLPPSASPLDVQTWHQFLSKLGVNDFLCVRREEVQLEQSKLRSSPWSAFEGVWPSSVESYIIHDFTCDEFYQLATQSNRSPDVMKNLYCCLDKMWDSLYKDFQYTQLKSLSGDVLKDTVETSFFIHLKTLPWVPAHWLSVDMDTDDEHPSISPEKGCRPPHHLYTQHPNIKALLGDTVEYLDIQDADCKSSFTTAMQVKHEIKRETMKAALISWGERDPTKAKTPKVFMTKQSHIRNVYEFLNDGLSRKESQDLFHEHPVFFIPLYAADLNQPVAGHMMKREEVCWQDDSGLFTKHQKSLKLYQSSLATFRFMRPFYQGYEEMFQQARLKASPDVLDCSELLKHMASVLSLQDEGTLRDTLVLMTRIGMDLSKKDCIEAGVQTIEAMQAQTNVEKVKNILSPCAVFPTKGGKWVSLADQPMVSDSPELEQMFMDKAGVHFLQLDLPDTHHQRHHTGSRRKSNKYFDDMRSGIDEDSVKTYLSLFEGIKPLSDCINTKIITPGFKPCFKGQMYMHNVIPLLQKFLYFNFPEVYDEVKSLKASTFGELQFIQVQKLEVQYEFVDRPDVCEFREDKCYAEDKMFYFHEKYIDEQAEVHREVAKFLSHGDEECCKEMRNFLSQAMAILEGKSNESLDDLLLRQREPIYDLPEDEPLWEVPLPLAPPPEPEPVSTAMDVVSQEEMVYGRALSVPDSETAAAEGKDDDVMRAWPPRSHVDIPPAVKGKTDSTSAKCTDGPDYVKASRQLPSNIEFEIEPQPEEEASDAEKPKSRVVKGSSASGALSSQTSKESSADKLTLRKEKQTKEPSSGVSRQSSQAGGDGSSVDGDLRQHVVTLAEKDGKGPQTDAQETGENRKRKRRGGSDSESETNQSFKRPNSVELPSQVSDRMESTSTERTADDDDNDMEESGDQIVVVPSSGDGRDSVKGVEGAHVSPKKNKYLRLSIPLWSGNMEDLKYTEVASGRDLNVDQKALPEHAQLLEIGQWGEALVYNYLLKQMNVNPSILDVVWANEVNETGLPYDIEIVFKTENEADQYSVFVDVKATVSDDKAVFEISPRQVEYAMHHKERYQIFRLYNAGKEDVRLVRIDNVADRMLTKNVKLYLMI